MAINLPQELTTLFSTENTYLVPSRISNEDANKLVENWKQCELNQHVFITSSGTTSSDYIKSYALSYDAIKANAFAVNSLINASSNDRWLSSLPIYHVGGLSIYARAILSDSTVIEYNEKWNSLIFVEKLKSENIQFCSIVPTQLYDLVQSKQIAPSNLKAVFVGGDYTPKVLYEKAIKLGWPLYLTFGMTEVCSQLATNPPGEYRDEFKVYDIHDIKLQNSKLTIKSKSIFTAMYEFKNESFKKIIPHFEQDYFVTNDMAQLIDKDGDLYIKPLGRLGDEVKINGRLINLLSLKNKVSEICHSLGVLNQIELVVVDDQRSGKAFELWVEENAISKLDFVLEQIIEIRVSNIRRFEKLPRNNLGKLIRNL